LDKTTPGYAVCKDKLLNTSSRIKNTEYGNHQTEVTLLELNLMISVNGVPMSVEEMKQYVFFNDTVEKAISEVNKRLKGKAISTNDRNKK